MTEVIFRLMTASRAEALSCSSTALDAVISLKITSAMVGGLRLAKLAELLESVIRLGDFGQGQALMERVAADGGQTVSELQATYILEND